MTTTFETISVDFDEKLGIGYLTLDRPDSLNALNQQLRKDIISGLKYLESKNVEEKGVLLRAVVIEGAGSNFCAGADINEFSDRTAGDSSSRSHYKFIREFPAPVIAKIRGYCLGGGLETALSCDFRFANEEAQFGLPEVDLGLIPGAGGVPLVSELANPTSAKKLAMTGEYISAEDAEEIGILTDVYGEDFNEKVSDFVKTIAEKPPLAIQAVKRSTEAVADMNLEAAIEYDARQFEPLLNTDDHERGVRGFSEDDFTPEFRGR